MSDDTRDAASKTQRGAQRFASDTALPFQVYNRRHRFVDELNLTPAAYRTLVDLGMNMNPVLHDDDTVAQWLDTAEDEQKQNHEFDGYIVAGYDEGAFLKADWDGEVHPNLTKGLNALNECRAHGFDDYGLYGLAKIDLKEKP